MHLLAEALVRPLWYQALLSQLSQQPRVGRLEGGDQLAVVRVGDIGRVDPVLLARLDRLGEHRLGEERLQLLIRKVDAQLLERVLLEDLEAEDIDNPDDAPAGAELATGGQRRVDLRDELVEELRVDGLCERVAVVVG